MSPAPAPASICLLRLSALGDVTHVLPLLRRMQRAWPGARFTWIVGKLEARLLAGVEGVDFRVYDKREGLAGVRRLRRELADQRFDALLLLQVALRANLVSLAVRADRRIGYDRARSRDGHGLFIGERIAPGRGQHVLEAIGSFAAALGLDPEPPRWELPIGDAAREFAAGVLPGGQPTLLISPCASHALRNWRPERYAALADHAVAAHGWRVLLCGGRSGAERAMGDAILAAARQPITDAIGKDTIEQLPALLERADLVVTPDSGPMHIANAVGTKVLGLHAASNPHRSGPYSDRRFCVDRYPDAAREFLGKTVDELPWGAKIERPGVMDLVSVDDAVAAFERFVEVRAQDEAGASPAR